MPTTAASSMIATLLLLLLSGPHLASAQQPSTDADTEAIRSLFDRILEAAASGDVDALLSSYTADAVWMFGDRWTDVDREGAAAMYRLFFAWATPDRDRYTISLDEVTVTGEWAYVRSTHRGLVVEKDGGEAVKQGSRHLSILKRQPDGSWKIACDLFVNPPLSNEMNE